MLLTGKKGLQYLRHTTKLTSRPSKQDRLSHSRPPDFFSVHHCLRSKCLTSTAIAKVLTAFLRDFIGKSSDVVEFLEIACQASKYSELFVYGIGTQTLYHYA